MTSPGLRHTHPLHQRHGFSPDAAEGRRRRAPAPRLQV